MFPRSSNVIIVGNAARQGRIIHNREGRPRKIRGIAQNSVVDGKLFNETRTTDSYYYFQTLGNKKYFAINK